jgi:hypothetical protein
MLQHDDLVLFQKKIRTNRNQSLYFLWNNIEIMAFVTIMSTKWIQFRETGNRNLAKFGVGVKLIVILRHIIAYFSLNIRCHSQNASSDSRKWLIKHLFPPSSCKKQINKQISYLLLAFLQSGSVMTWFCSQKKNTNKQEPKPLFSLE